MKLTGELKDKVDQTANLEEAKDVIAKAGMLLTDDEVSEVAGGDEVTGVKCPYCGVRWRDALLLSSHIKHFCKNAPKPEKGTGEDINRSKPAMNIDATC